MKKTHLLLLFGALIASSAFVFIWQHKLTKTSKAQELPSDSQTVFIRDDGFYPESLSVKVGSTVTFVNKDEYWHWPASDPHPSHTFYSELDPKAPIKPNGQWSVIVTKEGKWDIHDHLAPYIVGTVTVSK